MKPLLSVIVLSFNTNELLRQCLLSTIASKGFQKGELEVIVVDNCSSDGSAEMVNKDFTLAKLIINRSNVGFAAGNNVGIKAASGKYVLLLNSDTEFLADTLRSMVDFIQTQENIGAATCKILLSNGDIDPACHRGFPTPWSALTYIVGLEKIFPHSATFGGYHQGWKNLTVTHDVDVISGAFFLIPRRIIEKIGLLDEQFFMYGEDIDWCYRIKQAGYRVAYHPSLIVTHRKKQSGRNKKHLEFQDQKAGKLVDETRRRSRRYFVETMEQFYLKHYRHQYPSLLTITVLLALRIWKRLV